MTVTIPEMKHLSRSIRKYLFGINQFPESYNPDCVDHRYSFHIDLIALGQTRIKKEEIF